MGEESVKESVPSSIRVDNFNFCMKSSFHVYRDTAENVSPANLKIHMQVWRLNIFLYPIFARAHHLKHITLPVLCLKKNPEEN